MSVPVYCNNNMYLPPDIIEPDERVVVILQDKNDGTIIQKSLELKYLSRLLASVKQLQKSHPNRYSVVQVHSFTKENKNDEY